ncbi:MAG: hypothetical protein CK425_01350 [Parachlamydia sp.]|nr:MAG: hypothetical protein CK425_01350 [Parachlamydia sp.]
MKLKSFALFMFVFVTCAASHLSAHDKKEAKQENINYDELKKRAFASAKAGNSDKAILEIEGIIAQQPESPWGYKLRGNIFFYMKNYELALKDFDKVVKLRPACANAYVDRAIALMAIGDLNGARANIERAIELKPMSAFAYCVREKIYLEMAQSKADSKSKKSG